MAESVPVTELSDFSSPNATPTAWSQARVALADAELYWLSTVRPDGRPHVTPLLGIWLEGALYFCTGEHERKAKNLSANRHCVLTTGESSLDGLDLVIEGTAEGVSDQAELERVADTYESKYGPHFAAPDGTWSGLGDAIRQAGVLVYRVAPEIGFGFGKGEKFSQTRWGFTHRPWSEK
jgi:general stress protein 26